MTFQGIAFQPTRASSSPHFLKIVVEVKTLGPPHVLILLLGVSKGMHPAVSLRSNKASFCVSIISWRSQDCHKVEVNLTTLGFGDINRFKIVVSVCLIKINHCCIGFITDVMFGGINLT